LFSYVDNSVAANLTSYLAIDVAWISGYTIVLSMVASFSDVLDFIPTFLSRLAVMAARIENELAIDHVTVDDIAVVANLAFVLIYDAIAATADLYTYSLIECTLLIRFTTHTILFAEIGRSVDARAIHCAYRDHADYHDGKAPDSNPMLTCDSMVHFSLLGSMAHGHQDAKHVGRYYGSGPHLWEG